MKINGSNIFEYYKFTLQFRNSDFGGFSSIFFSSKLNLNLTLPFQSSTTQFTERRKRRFKEKHLEFHRKDTNQSSFNLHPVHIHIVSNRDSINRAIRTLSSSKY
ncbi:unnamed protein product [Lathyrus oleraceus]